MRFKISQQGVNRHKKIVTCVTWSAIDEIYSTGEDRLLVCWNFEGGLLNSKIVAEFPEDFYPTEIQMYPRPIQSNLSTIQKHSVEVLLIATADGKFHLVGRDGRIEKSVVAHTGSTLGAKWSHDGSALLTAGEDGMIKIWSRSGMLRTTVVRGNQAVLASAWSPNSSSILYSQGTHLLIQSLTTSAKPQKWQAHDGLILTLAWNHFNGLIISGGEDCRYKVWDSNGNALYFSPVGDYPVTAANWCYSGAYFAIGSFNTLKLCDKTGWTHSLEKLNSGSIYTIAWSNDGTQVALACGSGSVLIAHTIEKKLEWNGYEATLIKRKTVKVTDVSNNVDEILDIADRVVLLEFGFDHLVVVTPNQCHIYAVSNWNTPAIVDNKTGSVSAIILAQNHFLIVEWNALTLYSYQGRSLGSPKWKGMTQEPLCPPCISLCFDTLVVRDQTNEKLIHVLEISSKKPITEVQPYIHVENVCQLDVNHIGGPTERQMALIDSNRELFLVSIRSSDFGRVCKIAVMAQSLCWASDANVLAGMLDTVLSVWLCPNCVYYSDRKIIRKTRVDRDNSEYGKHSTIISVHNGMVTVRRGDGALIVTSFYTFFTSLHQHLSNGRWEEGISLCRIAQNETLWTCMAVMAIDSKKLEIAEEACAAIERYDKVDYIRFIKKMPTEVERLAHMALLAGDLFAAEGILLQNGLTTEAIKINLEMYNWNRALELAVKHKRMLQEVINARKRYLEILEKKEINQNFLNVQANLNNRSNNSSKDHNRFEKQESNGKKEIDSKDQSSRKSSPEEE